MPQATVRVKLKSVVTNAKGLRTCVVPPTTLPKYKCCFLLHCYSRALANPWSLKKNKEAVAVQLWIICNSIRDAFMEWYRCPVIWCSLCWLPASMLWPTWQICDLLGHHRRTVGWNPQRGLLLSCLLLAKLHALNFGVGVATGIPMEFQFGKSTTFSKQLATSRCLEVSWAFMLKQHF